MDSNQQQPSSRTMSTSRDDDDDEMAERRRSSQIEMLQSFPHNMHNTTLGPLNDSVTSNDDSNYESIHEQLHHTMSAVRGSNSRNDNNDNNNSTNQDDGEMPDVNGTNDDMARSTNENTPTALDENNENMIERRTSEKDENNMSRKSSHSRSSRKSRHKRINSEPPALRGGQLADFQQSGNSNGSGETGNGYLTAYANKTRNKRAETTGKAKKHKRNTSLSDLFTTGSGTRSVPYRLMEDRDTFEPSMLSQTATLHPAKADAHFLADRHARSRFERLDFDLQESEIIHRMTWNRGRKHDSRGFTKWTLCLIIGFITGTFMFGVAVAIDQLKTWNTNFASDGFQDSILTGFLRFAVVNFLCSLVAACLVVYISPPAAGSGIPDVKAWLNGSYIPTLFSAKTLIVKLIGIVFSVSGFFVVGKEGPMVHTGSALAAGVALGRNKALGIDFHINYSFRNDADARDLISCGAGAGVSAAFGAPIGGMLFALEEVSSFWQPGLTWRAFFTSATSNFILQLWLGCYHLTCGEVSKSSLIEFDSSATDITEGLYNMKEFLFFIIMGCVGGIVGMLFNAINVKLCLWRKQNLKTQLSKVIEVLCCSFLTSLLLGLCPLMVDCDKYDSGNDSCTDPYSYGSYNCDKDQKQWNPLASLFLVSSEDVIAALFHESSGCWTSSVLLLGTVIYFVLAVVTYGISIPSGLFVPLILIGSNLGHFLGDFWNDLWDDDFDVGTYALIGASAVLGGSTRMTISLTAIVLEITNDVYYLMPIMTTIMVSKWVGDRFNSALYDSHVGLKDIPFLEAKLPSWVPTYICADDIMNDTVVTLPIVINLKQMIDILNNPNLYHNAFPIIESKSKLSPLKTSKHHWKQTSGRYVGIILRWHILIMISKGLYSKSIPELRKLERLDFKDLAERTHKGDRKVDPEKYNLPPHHEWKDYYLDLSSYMSLSPHSMVRQAPIRRVYHMFRAFGMRHLVIIDSKTQLIAGIITTQELLEPNLEETVERVHHLFDCDPSKTDELFEERLRFLAGKTATLRTSGNENNVFYHKLQSEIVAQSTRRGTNAQSQLNIINDEKAINTSAMSFNTSKHSRFESGNDLDAPMLSSQISSHMSGHGSGHGSGHTSGHVSEDMDRRASGFTGIMDRVNESPTHTPPPDHSPDDTPEPMANGNNDSTRGDGPSSGNSRIN